MTFSFTLADSTRVRCATGSIMSFAQGIPQGLLAITIPAWLASEGVGAGDIGSYLAVIVPPWAFKDEMGHRTARADAAPCHDDDDGVLFPVWQRAHKQRYGDSIQRNACAALGFERPRISEYKVLVISYDRSLSMPGS